MLLPENYELVAGKSKVNIHLCYELNKVSIMANVQLSVDNTPEDCRQLFHSVQFNRLAYSVFPDKFVIYSVDFDFLR